MPLTTEIKSKYRLNCGTLTDKNSGENEIESDNVNQRCRQAGPNQDLDNTKSSEAQLCIKCTKIISTCMYERQISFFD